MWKKTVAVKSRRFDSDAWRGAELWDLLDEDGMPVGATHVRGEAMPHGAYHRVVEIFTLNSKGEMLVTKRSPEKKPYPNMWEITGGAVVAGEDSLDAARRELREETGIVTQIGELELLLTHRSKSAFVDIYLSNTVISLLRHVIPDKVRIPAYITIIASFVSIVQMLVKAFAPALDESLGIYLPLIVVNCIILGRAEMYASKHAPDQASW